MCHPTFLGNWCLRGLTKLVKNIYQMFWSNHVYLFFGARSSAFCSKFCFQSYTVFWLEMEIVWNIELVIWTPLSRCCHFFRAYGFYRIVMHVYLANVMPVCRLFGLLCCCMVTFSVTWCSLVAFRWRASQRCWITTPNWQPHLLFFHFLKECGFLLDFGILVFLERYLNKPTIS